MSTTTNPAIVSRGGRKGNYVRGGGTPPQKIIAKVVSYDLKGEPHPTVKVQILMPLTGRDGGEITKGTEIVAYSRPVDVAKAQRDEQGRPMLPRGVVDMTKPRGSGPALGLGSIVELDTCWQDNDGKWVFRGAHGFAPVEHLSEETKTVAATGEQIKLRPKVVPIIDQMIMVSPVYQAKPPATGPRQRATILLVNNAAQLTPDESGNHLPKMRTILESFLKSPVPGAHAVAIIARDLSEGAAADPLSRNGITCVLLDKKGEDGVYRPLTAEEAYETVVNEVKAEKPVEGTPSLLDVLEGKVKNYQVEFVPGISALLAADLVPGGGKEGESRRQRDLSRMSQLFEGSSAEDVSEFGYGFFGGYAAPNRFPEENAYSLKIIGSPKAYPLVYSIYDLPTKNITAEHSAAVKQVAEANATLAKMYAEKHSAMTRNTAGPANQQQQQTPAAAPEVGGAIPF